jgi:anti-anti-sigma regulatory factor
VKVEGKGSFLNSDNLKEFARAMLDQGYREFVVDLADCAMMDSTFMGTMARLALRLRELRDGHLHIVHCGSRNQQLLSGLGLDRIFDIDASVLNKIVFSGERRGKARKTSPFLELASVFVCFLLKTDHLFAESEF